jgi:hypothetical protein
MPQVQHPMWNNKMVLMYFWFTQTISWRNLFIYLLRIEKTKNLLSLPLLSWQWQSIDRCMRLRWNIRHLAKKGREYINDHVPLE